LNNELTAYAESLRGRLELVIAAVRGLDAAQLNWRPPVDGANSVWVLATHTAGNARAWILGIACGRDLGRDRPAEFASSGDDAAQLIASIDRTIVDVGAALRDLDPSRLDVRLVPAQELWGEGAARDLGARRDRAGDRARLAAPGPHALSRAIWRSRRRKGGSPNLGVWGVVFGRLHSKHRTPSAIVSRSATLPSVAGRMAPPDRLTA